MWGVQIALTKTSLINISNTSDDMVRHGVPSKGKKGKWFSGIPDFIPAIAIAQTASQTEK